MIDGIAYTWKQLPEAVRGILLALAAFFLTVLVDFDPAAVTDWKAYAVGIGVGALHVFGTATLAVLGVKAKLVKDADALTDARAILADHFDENEAMPPS